MSIRGDIATIRSFLSDQRRSDIGGQPWHATIEDGPYGSGRVTGLYFPAPAACELAILVHGLGGNACSSYMPRATKDLLAQGISVLRLSQRGADKASPDLHHVALWEDLAEVLSATPAVNYPHVSLVGFSMGGHVGLHLARRQYERLAGVVAICSPLLLNAAVDWMDRPRLAVYRHYLLRSLKAVYRAVARSRPVLTPPEIVDRVTTLREWDRLTVVARFGFESTLHYYESQSVGRHLSDLRTRSLLIYTEGDPMVPPVTLQPALAKRGSTATVGWVPGGGHMAFPLDLNLGFCKERGLYPQVVAWLREGKS